MDYKFTKKIGIKYSDTDYLGRLTPARFLEFLQEASMIHGDMLGYTVNGLKELGHAFAITDWHIVICRTPKIREELNISTWIGSLGKMRLQRNYRVADAMGRPVSECAARFIFIDLEKRRPENFINSMNNPEMKSIPTIMKDEKFQMRRPEEADLFSSREFTVERGALDTSLHVNNTKYLEWAMDDVPDGIFDAMELYDIRVVYRKECTRNDRVTAKTYIRGTDDEAEVITEYYKAGENGPVLFSQINTLWRGQ